MHGHACTGDRKNSTENRNSKNCLVRADFLKIFQFSCALLCNMMHVCRTELKHAKKGGKGVPLSIFIMMIMTYTNLFQFFSDFCKPNSVMFHIMNIIKSKMKRFQCLQWLLILHYLPISLPLNRAASSPVVIGRPEFLSTSSSDEAKTIPHNNNLK